MTLIYITDWIGSAGLACRLNTKWAASSPPSCVTVKRGGEGTERKGKIVKGGILATPSKTRFKCNWFWLKGREAIHRRECDDSDLLGYTRWWVSGFVPLGAAARPSLLLAASCKLKPTRFIHCVQESDGQTPLSPLAVFIYVKSLEICCSETLLRRAPAIAHRPRSWV